MINILYAAADHSNSKIQLSRFLDHLDFNKYNIKIAAYKKSSPNINIDWTLDCLYNIFTKRANLDNYYLDLYYKQIKSFSPDLVISDMEYFTTYVAHELNYEVWQCSSSLIDFAISHKDKYASQIYNNYSAVLNKSETDNQNYLYMTSNSSKNFVYSYFCDVENKPTLNDGFEWIRPYFVLGEESSVCKHNVVAATLNKNTKIMNFLNNYNDSVLFNDQEYFYKNINCKKINNEDEFACNIKNCNIFVCQGHMNFMADAVYNEKGIVVIPDLFDGECVINSMLSKKYNICDVIFHENDIFDIPDFKLNIDSSIYFLTDLLL